VTQGLGMMLALNVPASIGLAALAHPIVAVLFERGRFVAADTAATAAAVRFYAVGLVGYASVRIASPVFYAIGQSRVPVLVSVISIGVNVIVSIVLVHMLGFRGLALGTSIAALANGGALLVLLHRRLDGINGPQLAGALVKIALASTAMAAVAFGTEALTLATISGSGLAVQALRLFCAIAAGIATLVVSAKLLGVREFDEIRAWAQVRKLLDPL